MKTLQERMNDMMPYFRGVEMYNEALMVKVVYPDKWKAYPSEDGKINVTISDDGKVTYYYANSKDTTYDEIFDLVEQTIKANNDIFLKLKLLREKVEELKELFQVTTYDDLLSLKFVIENKNSKPKRKYVRKKKVEEINEEVENNVAKEEEKESLV